MWVLLVSLFQVARRRQAQVVFGDEFLLQRLEGMKCGGQCVLGYTVWVPGLSLDFMGIVTQCYLDARLSFNYLPFHYVPHIPTSPQRIRMSQLFSVRSDPTGQGVCLSCPRSIRLL